MAKVLDLENPEIVLVGVEGKTYDLEELQNENTRLDSTKPLLIQVYEYKEGENPNPENPKIGQIWLSKRVDGE